MSAAPPTPGTSLGRFYLLRELRDATAQRDRTRRFLALDRSSARSLVLTLPDVPDAASWVESRRATPLGDLEGVAPRLVVELVDEHPLEGAAWIAGVPLPTLLQRASLPLGGAARLLWQIRRALDALHSAGHAHGDLTAGNVVLTTEGYPVLVGGVVAPTPEVAHRQDTPPPPHAPPEWTEDPTPTPAGDVFSFGLLAYELLAGSPAIPGDARGSARLEALARLQAGLLEGAGFGRPIPSELGAALASMLRVDPDQRPRHSGEFQEALLRASPASAARDAPASSLGPALAEAVATRRRYLQQASRTALDRGDIAAAASRLARYAELWPIPEAREMERIAGLIREILWETLRPGAREGRATEAAATCLFHASFDLGVSGLISLCRHRLAALGEDFGPLTSLLPDAGERAELQGRREQLLAYLRANPRHENAALALAILEGAPAADPRGPRNLWKASVLEGLGLPAAALLRATPALAERPSDPILLETLVRLAQATRDQARASQITPPPASDPVPAPPPPPRPPPRPVELPAGEEEVISRVGALGMEEADVVFTRGQILIHEGKLAEAAEAFESLVDAGALEQEHYRASVGKEVQRMLWTALARVADPTALAEGLRRILRLVDRLDLAGLLPLCERMALNASAAAGETSTESLRAIRPRSAILLEAAASQAAVRGDLRAQARHALALANVLLDSGDAPSAAAVIEGVEADTGLSEDVAQVRRRLGEARAARIQADAEFGRLRKEIARQDPEVRLVRLEDFLTRFPEHPKAMADARQQAYRSNDTVRAGRLAMAAARRAFVAGALAEAREGFRHVLAGDPENHEALLYLAALVPPEPDPARDLLELRVELLAREGLIDAALHQGRRALRGGSRDLPVYGLLVKTSEDAGLDPSPYLLAQGHLVLAEGDRPLAKALFRRAAAMAAHREEVVEGLLQTPGIAGLFNPTELMRLRDG